MSLRPLPLALLLASTAAAQDVRFEEFTSPSWPAGLDVSKTNGCGWGDLDGDGWADFFGARSGQLWHNLGGADWELVPDVVDELYRYGCSIGDYDNDGLGDIALEPRMITNEKMKLLHNLGGFVFENVGEDPVIVDSPPFGDSETACWADVDFDGNLDLFLPVYPPWAMGGGRGNFFLHNQGPVGPGGAYTFIERSGPAELDNPPGTSRPEGAEFCDVDLDGDLDCFSNGTIYQNVSGVGVPLFLDVSDNAGLVMRDVLDEGACLFDHDLDGDFDLVVMYCQPTEIRVYENKGDGVFNLLKKGTVEPQGGSCIDMSKVDWDNDGDIDFTTDTTFRRNMLVETGQRGFVQATHDIPGADLDNTAFSWADWDQDGDVDVLLHAWSLDGGLWNNQLYGADTPADERRYVRVRVVNDSRTVERGLETEYGAAAEVVVLGDSADGWRRRNFVTSSGGYLNQNEYVLHFALPPDPDPEDPEVDLEFDLSVDFPSEPAAGLQRVDRHVNPALGRVALAELTDRTITVYRGGRVRLGDCVYEPFPGASPLVHTTTGGLALVSDTAALPVPTDAPGPDWYVGTVFDTTLATTPLRLKEVVVDGALDGQDAGCTPGKIALWDTTDPMNPLAVGEPLDVPRYGRNDRTGYRANWLLQPGREYRLVARVNKLRATPITAPVVTGPLTVHGGLSFTDANPCDGAAVVAAGTDPTQVWLAARVSEESGPMWVDLGYCHAGTNGDATLTGSGEIDAGSPVTLDLAGALPNTLTILIASEQARCRPVGGGVLVPETDVLLPLTTDGGGGWSWSGNLPANLPPGTTTFFQAWWFDLGAVKLRAASNALSATTPY